MIESRVYHAPEFRLVRTIRPNTGVKDAEGYWHDEVRHQAGAGNLMAGGTGRVVVGYQYAHDDLNREDWRSRGHLSELTRYALELFLRYLQLGQPGRGELLPAAG